MNTDYWQKFVATGSVVDYLNYRNSIKKEKDGKSDNKSDRDSNKRGKNQRK